VLKLLHNFLFLHLIAETQIALYKGVWLADSSNNCGSLQNEFGLEKLQEDMYNIEYINRYQNCKLSSNVFLHLKFILLYMCTRGCSFHGKNSYSVYAQGPPCKFLQVQIHA
jgi:hypothetical protein